MLLHFYLGSFSYTSHVDFVFIWGDSLTHPTMTSILSGQFLLHIPCLHHFYLGSFSYTSRAGFNSINWLSLTHLMLVSFYRGSFSYTSRADFIFICGFSLTHPVLASFLCGKFLLHIPCWSFLCADFLLHIPCCLHFYAVSFSNTSGAVLISMQGISLTNSKLAFFFFLLFFKILSGEFLWQIPRKSLLHMLCWLNV